MQECIQVPGFDTLSVFVGSWMALVFCNISLFTQIVHISPYKPLISTWLVKPLLFLWRRSGIALRMHDKKSIFILLYVPTHLPADSLVRFPTLQTGAILNLAKFAMSETSENWLCHVKSCIYYARHALWYNRYCFAQWILNLPGNFEIHWVRQYFINIALSRIKDLWACEMTVTLKSNLKQLKRRNC